MLFSIALALMVGIGSCQNSNQACSPPTASDLETVIAAIIQSGDASTDPVISLMNHNLVCRTFAQQKGFLRGVSVVVEYTCDASCKLPNGHCNRAD